MKRTWKQTEEFINLSAKICERAESMGIRKGTRITAMVDIDHAVKHFHIDLQKWLDADDFNFAHDFIGIQNHIDRVNGGAFDNTFLPRFATEVKA